MQIVLGAIFAIITLFMHGADEMISGFRYGIVVSHVFGAVANSMHGYFEEHNITQNGYILYYGSLLLYSVLYSTMHVINDDAFAVVIAVILSAVAGNYFTKFMNKSY